MHQQARNLVLMLAEIEPKPKYLVHDQDGAFLPLDAVLGSEGMQIIHTPPHAPMCNAYAERFVCVSQETLDNLIVLGGHHFHPVL